MKISKLIANMFLLACTIFTHIALPFDLIEGFSNGALLKLGASAVIFLLSFVFSAFFVIFKENIKLFSSKIVFICTISTFFTAISLVLKILVTIINTSNKFHWELSVFSILTIFAFSVAVSMCIHFLKTKSIALKAFIYFLIIGISYYLITVTIGGLNTGNNLILILGIYLGAYAVVLITILLIINAKKAKDLEKRPYKRQF